MEASHSAAVGQRSVIPTAPNTRTPYVPENFTQIRKLKIGVDLAPATQLYALLHHGSTDNLFRNTRRNFGGADLRLTDRTIPGSHLDRLRQVHAAGQPPASGTDRRRTAGIRPL
jgi:hypothetical protein